MSRSQSRRCRQCNSSRWFVGDFFFEYLFRMFWWEILVRRHKLNLTTLIITAQRTVSTKPWQGTILILRFPFIFSRPSSPSFSDIIFRWGFPWLLSSKVHPYPASCLLICYHESCAHFLPKQPFHLCSGFTSFSRLWHHFLLSPWCRASVPPCGLWICFKLYVNPLKLYALVSLWVFLL